MINKPKKKWLVDGQNYAETRPGSTPGISLLVEKVRDE